MDPLSLLIDQLGTCEKTVVLPDLSDRCRAVLISIPLKSGAFELFAGMPKSVSSVYPTPVSPGRIVVIYPLELTCCNLASNSAASSELTLVAAAKKF